MLIACGEYKNFKHFKLEAKRSSELLCMSLHVKVCPGYKATIIFIADHQLQASQNELTDELRFHAAYDMVAMSPPMRMRI